MRSEVCVVKAVLDPTGLGLSQTILSASTKEGAALTIGANISRRLALSGVGSVCCRWWKPWMPPQRKSAKPTLTTLATQQHIHNNRYTHNIGMSLLARVCSASSCVYLTVMWLLCRVLLEIGWAGFQSIYFSKTLALSPFGVR